MVDPQKQAGHVGAGDRNADEARYPTSSRACVPTAPGVPLAAEAAGPSFQEVSSKSGCYQPAQDVQCIFPGLRRLLTGRQQRLPDEISGRPIQLAVECGNRASLFDDLPVVGHQAVHFDFDVGGLGVDGGGRAATIRGRSSGSAIHMPLQVFPVL